MKKTAICLVLIIGGFTPFSATAEVLYPDLPVQTSIAEETSDTVVIVGAKEGNLSEAIEEVSTQVPTGVIRKTFSTLYNGFSLSVPKKDLASVKALKYVERVDEVATYQAALEESVPFIGAGSVRGMLDESGHRLTGEGVKVAVIDTGIDYTHPDLMQNYKGGYDLIDSDGDPMETLARQGPPTLHGTHVAGIIAANGRVQGVAPEAEIYAYRALGPGGQGTTEQVIEAIEKAVEDDVDVLNLSLGNTVNGPDWPTSLALDKAVDAGVVAVTSSGNSGPGMWTVGSPGTAQKAISVGASAPPMQTPYITIPSKDKELELNALKGAERWTLTRDFEFVPAGYGMEDDYSEVEVRGRIALVKRGRISFQEKVKAAVKAGAVGVLIYNNTSGSFVGGLEQPSSLPAGTLSQEDGEWLLNELESTHSSTIRTMYRKEQDFLAPFSSRGPVTFSWEVKPDLVAPGMSIDSTVPGGYTGLDGTSMSSPHVAGAAALLVQAHPDWTPEQVKAALMNSAKQLMNKENKPYAPHEQGAGRLQVDKALKLDTLVYPAAVTFGKWSKNDVREKRSVTFTVENQSDQTNTYHIDPPFVLLDGMEWHAPSAITLKPKEKQEVTLSLDLMPSILGEGIHYDHIKITGGREDILVPYILFMEEPDYPRVMAFQFVHGDKPNTYRYEYYLPGGAEESGIALYDPDTFQFITYLETRDHTDRGMVQAEMTDVSLPPGMYKALVFAKQEGRQDIIESMIQIDEE
ncbi:S8 family serine peptidase [Alkalicoccobacillus murimartini]|uniref:Minor extracellular serine protease Vpr n=1 Tax=Alkalicoccobacillus murimartini TaxID=171685 RepID=A0ABT9YHF8_9BACI|nr:S8 family serine peptidase [Alkalicoccobacillus murimartini]MDQ0207043.1 minor extracellular serine protease Vpr [Alkalicoccobacillus murimartini]